MATVPTVITLKELVQRCDCFPYTRVDIERQYGRLTPLIVDGHVVGLLVSDVLTALREDARHLFNITDESVTFTDDYTDQDGRSKGLALLLEQWREADRFPALQGWRNELYAVYSDPYAAIDDSQCIAFVMERSAAVLFGVLTFGVHLNVYTKCPDTGSIKMWIAQRSATKPTWPGRLDNAVAGGIAFGDSIYGTAIKECMEEANLPEHVACKARPTGTISYFTVTKLGLAPEIQYIYDLELLPPDTTALIPNDGEVGKYYLWDMDEVRSNLQADKFKPNCGMVVIDFMFRHGLLDVTEPDYREIQQRLHRRLVLDDYN
ncbi:NUDIX hydrolase domain-like protein [Syncephalis plumigaleata]|nr:NUDIX hydrolase domain-like protein [Syncephalis plumigaleata]